MKIPDPFSSAMDSNQNQTSISKKDLERAEDFTAKVKRAKGFVKAIKMLACGGVLSAAVAVSWYFYGWTAVPYVLLPALGIYIATGRRWRWFYIAAITAPRDIKALLRFVRLVILNRSVARKNKSIVDLFRENVAKHPDKVMFLFEDQQWTFLQVEEYSNQVAHVFKKHGYKKGDAVALFLENRPEFVCLWLGLAKLGVIVPLINYNQRDQSLLHSFTVAHSQAIIFGSELTTAMQAIAPQLGASVKLFRFSDTATSENDVGFGENLTALLAEVPKTAPEISDQLTYTDRLLYIYTSGTTGLPKAAVITSARFLFLCAGMNKLVGFRDDDRFYTPLPLYHTAGGIVVIGQAIVSGCAVVVRRKFSASAFFADCKKYECTVAQYIGEMCRYVLSTPPRPEDTEHKVRVIFGNGLRPQIWKEFVERFNIPQVAEFYGATEGNANIVNTDNTFGAIGFISRIIPALYPISIIKADPATGEPIRGADGLCQVCGPDEPGVFVGKIIQNDPSREFLGYVDKAASEKKIARDVFKKGDAAFLSGDIIVSDERGYLYFRDRTGDTFRWKGENVSTTEVEAVVSNLVNYRDCVVYGVQVENQEGRVGMAAILDEQNSLDINKLADGLKNKLPAYARPQIIRRLEKVDVTGTFKLRKVDLQKEGFDPKSIRDKLYYWTNGKFEILNSEAFDKIQSGDIRF